MICRALLVVQHFDRLERSALEKLHARPAAGTDVRHLVGGAEVLDRRRAVAAADDCDRAGIRRSSQRLRYRARTGIVKTCRNSGIPARKTGTRFDSHPNPRGRLIM